MPRKKKQYWISLVAQFECPKCNRDVEDREPSPDIDHGCFCGCIGSKFLYTVECPLCGFLFEAEAI